MTWLPASAPEPGWRRKNYSANLSAVSVRQPLPLPAFGWGLTHFAELREIAALMKMSQSNGTNRSVVIAHPGLFTAESRMNGGHWTMLTPAHTTEAESFRRLIARVCSGEIDPREHIDGERYSCDVRLVAVP